MNREDFPILQNDLIYFDNGATTLKPSCVIDAIVDYYRNYTANAHRGDYKNSLLVDEFIDLTRKAVQRFIHAKSEREIIFTGNATDSLNQIIFGFFANKLKKGDRVVLTKSEHASNVLPWFELEETLGIEIDYIPLDERLHVTLDHLKEVITEDTKVISIAEVTNVIGDVRPMKEIIQYAHEHGIYVLVDGAQSVPHQSVDVKDLDVDFLAFSGHKMCGPTGIGVLYGKYELLKNMQPTRLGGGSNSRYNSCGVVTLKNPPYRFEAGTPHIEGAIGLGAAIQYLMGIGMDNIHRYELELRKYCIEKMQQLDNVDIYNPDSQGAIAFNIKGVFSQDAASLFNSYGIAIRAGQHCAKILDEFLKVSTTLRASFYFYNTKEEIDAFIEVCKKGDDFLDAFFK